MSTAGLNVDKLKQLVKEKWGSKPDCWPVKVISMDRKAELRAQYGPLTKMGGYFTVLRAVQGRTPEEMEDILGFARGYLRSGASVWRFKRLPLPAEYELRGYSQLPGGSPFDGIVLRPEGATRPEFYGKKGEALTYIPGLAVEQWELKALVDAEEIGVAAWGQRFRS
ncbi:MAG: hypothetical protein SFV54_26990 [Bryobacteraceae bacterium]|nr:hypothetical protein [Bryobacteraceae bacterium]